MTDLFDAAAMYDEDYLHFFAAPPDRSEFAAHGPVVPGTDSSADAAAELTWRLLDLRPGMRVLGLPESFPALPAFDIGLLRNRHETSALADALATHVVQGLDNLTEAAAE